MEVNLEYFLPLFPIGRNACCYLRRLLLVVLLKIIAIIVKHGELGRCGKLFLFGFFQFILDVGQLLTQSFDLVRIIFGVAAIIAIVFLFYFFDLILRVRGVGIFPFFQIRNELYHRVRDGSGAFTVNFDRGFIRGRC